MALPAPRFPGVLSAQHPDGPSQTESEIEGLELGGDKPEPLTDDQVVQLLEGYREEAEAARLAGPTSRDRTWLQHLDLYYNRWDFSKKAQWQAREVLPEFPQYVDRFAAAMRMALVSQPEFFTISCDNDEEGDLSYTIRKFMSVILRRIGRSPSGHRVDFSAVFEEVMKMGALSMCVLKVTQRDDGGAGYTSLEVIDPYNYWLDPTGRNLYRIHREEVDLHQLRAMLEEVDDDGNPIFDQLSARSALQQVLTDPAANQAMMRAEKEKRTGTGQWYTSSRRPVIVHEYYCDLVDNQGFLRAKNCLFMVVNNKHLVRGMNDGEIGEPNPFWHGKDWMVATPIITVPLAPYGRSYAENFAQITRTFNEMTNLILDGVMVSTLRVFTVVPGYMEDSSQLEDGIFPNATYRLIEGIETEKFMQSIEMGSLDKQAFDVWQMLKKELQEGAAFNDMTLGNSAPNARTSAAEINTVDQNSTSYMRAIASNVETLLLEPALDLIWKTALQHLHKDDVEIKQAIGDKWFAAFLKMKKKFCDYKITFVCRGITSLLQRKQKMSEFMQMLQICAQNPEMTQILAATWPPQKLFAYIAMLLDVDVSQLEGTPRDQMVKKQMEQESQQKQQQAAQQDEQHKARLEAGKAQAKAHAETGLVAAKADAETKKEMKIKVLEYMLEHRKEQRGKAEDVWDKLMEVLEGGGSGGEQGGQEQESSPSPEGQGQGQG